MPIQSTDLLYKLSVTTTPGNTNAQSDVNLSLGEFMAVTQVTTNVDNNLFDDVSGDENAASDVEYRCIFAHNAHASLTLQNAKAWFSAEVTGGCNAAIGLDTTAASINNNATAQALEVANESTAPSGVSFSSPTSKATGLDLASTLVAGYVKGIWVRRTATASAAKNADGVTIKVEGDSAE